MNGLKIENRYLNYKLKYLRTGNITGIDGGIICGSGAFLSGVETVETGAEIVATLACEPTWTRTSPREYHVIDTKNL